MHGYIILIIIFAYLQLIAMQGHQKRDKDTKNLDTAQFCYIGSRIGWVSALQVQVHDYHTQYSLWESEREKIHDDWTGVANCQLLEGGK